MVKAPNGEPKINMMTELISPSDIMNILYNHLIPIFIDQRNIKTTEIKCHNSYLLGPSFWSTRSLS